MSHVMYERSGGDAKPQRVVKHQFPPALKVINEMMQVVNGYAAQHHILRHKLFQANYHCTRSGQAMVTLLYHKKLKGLESDWREAAQALK